MTESILIVGAGPVGLTLAIELARRGVRPRIVDRLAEPLPFCRALVVVPRTLEVYERMGVLDPMLATSLPFTGYRMHVPGEPVREVAAAFSDLPYGPCSIRESETERVLTLRLAELGIAVERGTALLAFRHDADGVSVELAGAGGIEQARFGWMIGCDGAHSTVRHGLGIAFQGAPLDGDSMLGEVSLDPPYPRGMVVRSARARPGRLPDHLFMVPLAQEGRYLVAGSKEPAIAEAAHGLQHHIAGPPIEELQALFDDLVGEPVRLTALGWSSYYHVSRRLAARYRDGRVVLAGDAAHIHSPLGGQGMNLGIQDAFNLGWKLALVATGRAGAALIDSYEPERRPAAAEVIARTTAALENLGRTGAAPPHRLADTQVLVSYRDGPLARDDWPETAQAAPGAGDPPPVAGDRAPDARGLRRAGTGHPLRLFDLLGPEFTLVVASGDDHAAVAEAARRLARRHGPMLRTLAIGTTAATLADGVKLVADAEGEFGRLYGAEPGRAWIVRPDGHILWRGAFLAEAVEAVLDGVLGVAERV